MSRVVEAIPVLFGAEAIDSAYTAEEERLRAGANANSVMAESGQQEPGILRDVAPPTPQSTRSARIQPILPHEKVFPIQIGTQLFKLSGASISSDAPSYFSAFFRCQLDQAQQRAFNGEDSHGIRTLYIDRDPDTFADISRHLQGYHITPRDGSHFVKLFADAQFYQLPRLIDQLYEDAIYISIGNREFRISKDLLSNPGDTPNYFTLGYGFLFSNPSEVFPGLKRDGLLRPPSIMAPAIPHHSADIFADLLHVMKGYPLHIRNEQHRKELLQDCKYYLFRGVEQKLIPHHISYNSLRKREEIVIRLEHIRQTGLTWVTDPSFTDGQQNVKAGWVNYQRPHVDDKSYELIVEIGNECTMINVQTRRAEFFGDEKTRISRLLKVIADKLDLPTSRPRSPPIRNGGAGDPPASLGDVSPSIDQVRIAFGNASVTLDGTPYLSPGALGFSEVNAPDEEPLARPQEPPRKRRGPYLDSDENSSWTIKTGQWRLRVQTSVNSKSEIEIKYLLVAVKLDALSGEPARNEQRAFLGT